MRGHEVKNHGKKDTYNEFTLYFEGRNLCETVYNSENPEMFRKRNRSAKIIPIMILKGICDECPMVIKHLEGLQHVDRSSKQANDAALRAYGELEKIDPKEKMRRFRWLNIILKCADLIID
jgi:hypothetical protein